MTNTDLNTPWTLEFDRNGTEDIATIRDADVSDIVTSRPFWLPEGDDPVPPTLAALRVMKAAPRMLEALKSILSDADAISYHTPHLGTEFWDEARSVIAEAEGRTG
jgi:hypothetical protein